MQTAVASEVNEKVDVLLADLEELKTSLVDELETLKSGCEYILEENPERKETDLISGLDETLSNDLKDNLGKVISNVNSIKDIKVQIKTFSESVHSPDIWRVLNK